MRRVILFLGVLVLLVGLLGATCRHEVYSPPDKPLKIEAKLEMYIRHDIHVITGQAPPEKTGGETLPEVKPGETPPPPEGKESGAGNVLLHVIGVGAAYAEAASDEEELKRVHASMNKRYPTLTGYKADKSIGENRSGYVAERPSPRISDPKYAAKVRETIAAENADRRVLYQVRARMVGTSPEKVAVAYAKTWRDLAKPGEWIEVYDPDKKQFVWIQKPGGS
jgi:uncharacterized protein YdbL (DUF1318 family)